MKAYIETSFNAGIKNASEPFNTRSCIVKKTLYVLKYILS